MGLRVTRAALDRMQAEAMQAAPDECCGILFGGDGTIEDARAAANTAADRRHHFEIDPQALVDAHRLARGGGPQVVGYFHSHPRGPAEPSVTDRMRSAKDRSVWAIIGESGVSFWRDEETGFVPLSYTVEDR